MPHPSQDADIKVLRQQRESLLRHLAEVERRIERTEEEMDHLDEQMLRLAQATFTVDDY